MKIFYIPDGHRRYADKVRCSLAEAYHLGYKILLDEIIRPLFATGHVTGLDIFLLSNLNLKRRDREELRVLLEEGQDLLASLIRDCSKLASVRTVGTYMPRNLDLQTVPQRQITLVLGCTTSDDVGCGEVDLFLRTGGEMRMSGAPRSVIGDYTQLYALDELHPELRFGHVDRCLDRYHHRYMRERNSA
jgi:undecaprenyl pyrophosphate synthase